MKRSLPIFLALLATLPTLSAAPAADAPAAAKESKSNPVVTMMQTRVWQRLNQTQFSLTGSVHGDKLKQRYPISLTATGKEILYKFTDQPLQLRISLDPGSIVLQKRTSDAAAWTTVTPAEYSKKILNTDITYGDIALDFINWDDITPHGSDLIKAFDCYVFEAKPGPNDHSPFASIRFWVSKQYWAFLRVDGLNAKGQTVKRVEVQDSMTVGKDTLFKQMKVANMDPTRDDIATSTTFLDLDEPK